MSTEDDVECLRGELVKRGFEATVYAWHGVSVRLPSGTCYGLHTKQQYERSIAEIRAGKPVLDVLRAHSG